MEVPMLFTVEIEKEDIICGIPRSASHCALARGVRRAAGAESVFICEDGIDVFYPDRVTFSAWPDDATEVEKIRGFMNVFDRSPNSVRRQLKPFSFSLRLEQV